MLSKNLSEISNLKYPEDDNIEELIQAVYSYESKLKNEKETLESKKEKNNDTVKEINSFLQIKQTDCNEYEKLKFFLSYHFHRKTKLVDEFVDKMRAKNLHSLIDGDTDFITAYTRIKEKLKQAEKKDSSMKLTAETLMKFFEK